jgi:hypothetical protein
VKRSIVSVMLVVLSATSAFAWHDETHLAIAKAAGYDKYYNAAGADMIKLKAPEKENDNHYYDNVAGAEVTPEMVLSQTKRYDQTGDREGHLYGAIIAALRNYADAKENGKYGEYHLAFAAHYIGDLSNPLHNTPYDQFNKDRHSTNDGVIEAEALKYLLLIERNMHEIKLDPANCESGLARQIARIANGARRLGYAMRREHRDMTKGEAYVQAGESASLLKAVLRCYRR